MVDWRKKEQELKAMQDLHKAVHTALEKGVSPIELMKWVEVFIKDFEVKDQMSSK